jgi:hypothetical protein
MKPAWPNLALSRWSKRLLRTLTLFFASVFLATGLAVPVYSAGQPALPLRDAAGLESLVAQNTSGNATLYFETPTFTVSVHPRVTGNQPLFMNVYNRDTRQSEQLNAPANFRGSLANDGWVSYDSFGSRAGRNVIYRASANRNAFQARLEIIDASTGSVLLSQNSTSIRDFNVPPGTGTGQGDLQARTYVGFETQNYSVRVFTDQGITKMNVFNRPSNQQVVNGQPATAEVPGVAPFECWASYFGGQSFNNAPARYFIRVSGTGEALLEVIGANGGVLLSEPRITTTPLVTNIPTADRPACFGQNGSVAGSLAPYIAAVFGGESELQEVRRLLTPGGGRGVGGLTCAIDPRFENARQGRFINAAECTGRNDAEAVVSFLRGRNINSRLVYRSFMYR